MLKCSIEDILSIENLRNTLFPVTRNRVFMAHAAVSPLPAPSAEKISEAAFESSDWSQETESFFETITKARETAAKLINAKPSEIALLGPTALGLNLVANGIPWKPGDEVVYYPDDYPTNVYPWKNLEKFGVKAVPLCPEEPGKITLPLVLSVLSSKTKLVALASCHYLSGYLLDYKEIGKALHDRGILFSLDGIQSLGISTMDSEYFDFLSADSHKWLLGPLGAGIFYCKESLQDYLAPSLLGAWNVKSPHFIAQETMELEKGARRYESGALYALGIIGMEASMDLLLAIGIDKIRERILFLHQYLRESLNRIGWKCLSDDFPLERCSGIISATATGVDPTELLAKLKSQGIIISFRMDRNKNWYIRFAPHFYNTEDEINRAIEILSHKD
ncbi:segregation protein B [Methylacidiphilum kamchatkense Kam1]|uniref:Segregation protein B n=1 Tax=Methylacidiphilum kamchatkense Kam1 TaxID=1202785 RepID=A0A0C1RTR2_9BACT|nr:aminotransferase class V-fold PLP-dependent enzyme [Methylacidiphilum kamchatkense]KIE58366.1 segregation protein B [Methylacidiphilum kamchatkense Kam1]QDQ42228.1 selenocysteine lyase/cysteine desulfurase [Methylacidiphilum kamchatkense Kam1]